TLRPQELIELLGRTDQGLVLARSRYSLGWLAGNAQLSPVVPAALVGAFVHGPWVRLGSEQHAGAQRELMLAPHTTLPVVGDGSVLVATASGFPRVARPADAQPTRRSLTRRALLEAAFQLTGSPYGLGDANGGRDCSGFLLDVFDAFDLALPRYSGWQADAGTFAIDLAGASESEKLRRLAIAARRGAVLLYFPGHIMLYLGQNERGTPMAVHALGEYARPCASGAETIVDVQRTVVSDLELGRGSSRKSFVERLTRLVGFGHEPPAELAGLLLPRPAAPPRFPKRGAACTDSNDARIFISPLTPLQGQPVRAIAAASTPLGDATLRVFDAEGTAVPIDLQQLGGSGPPQTLVARSDRPRSGRYTAVLGSADRPLACKRFSVRDAPMAAAALVADAPIWEPRWRWQRDTENLWSAFIEQLFAGPPDDEQTWTDLHALLADPARNLLHDHLGLGEDDKLSIAPDCADLPYALRAYFAWKLKLPFGFRSCSRGRERQPPTCGELHTTLNPRNKPDEVEAFAEFVNRDVRTGVHSATGRTAPDDSATDLYPVAFERAALAPGTVYADPYGHVMMVSKWFAQGSVAGSRYGVMMAAEAQPDGTIGRRRFWQGSFLFDPSTESVGAGFKRFRPLEYDRKTHTLSAPDNATLGDGLELPAWSAQQYAGTREDFYDRMDALINPQPLEPAERMHSLVDALEEAARRRVLAIDNAERYVREHPRSTIDMPMGRAIFETEGAWEDYATPSRDMRLLIAIDTVMRLPERVQRTPQRFALAAGTDLAKAAVELTAALERELGARSFTYSRSDGNTQTLSLLDVVKRSAAFELAYDPNDCAETRWGAAPGTPEAASCQRAAPQEQRARMQRYRSWFHTRTRPLRGQ
ncbi:MAG TPA: NlpC/P60 family protein, partial [Polyangiales bacterium]